ncbi:MAG TPA: 3-methyl-2-oxobutanoate hydroxymethyltransferase [Patescibacteria group bacterium]
MKKLTMLTAWDYPTAKVLEEAGIDYILVGDSLAMTVLGHPNTKSITLENMMYHTQAVSKGAVKTPIIADLPIGTYDNPKDALINANKLLAVGATMVKIEGNNPEVVKALISNNIQVVGHLGLLPQSAEKFTVVGREQEIAEKIKHDARQLSDLGISLLVLECIPVNLAKEITEGIATPTIGIGAGMYTTGQVLVLADIIGLSDKKLKMVKQYADVKAIIRHAVLEYIKDVEKGDFPKEENSFV